MADDGPDHSHLGNGSGMRIKNYIQHDVRDNMLTCNDRFAGDKETCFWYYSINLLRTAIPACEALLYFGPRHKWAHWVSAKARKSYSARYMLLTRAPCQMEHRNQLEESGV
jgi:hypothetical protein